MAYPIQDESDEIGHRRDYQGEESAQLVLGTAGRGATTMISQGLCRGV